VDLEGRRQYAEWFPEGEDDAERGERSISQFQGIQTYIIIAARLKKAEAIPKPPRHQETIQTFEKVVWNLSQMASVCFLLRIKQGNMKAESNI
jgi:hypothetical protein